MKVYPILDLRSNGDQVQSVKKAGLSRYRKRASNNGFKNRTFQGLYKIQFSWGLNFFGLTSYHYQKVKKNLIHYWYTYRFKNDNISHFSEVCPN